MFRLLNVTVYIFSLLVGSWLRHTIWVIWVICFSDTSGLACITNHFPLLTWHLNRARLHIHWPSHRPCSHHMYVRVRAHTCTRTYGDQTKEHTHILFGALLTAQPRAHKLTHTSQYSFNSLVSYIY